MHLILMVSQQILVRALLDPAVVGKLFCFTHPPHPGFAYLESYGWIIILLDSNRDKRKRDKLKIAVSPNGLLYYKHLSDPDKV